MPSIGSRVQPTGEEFRKFFAFFEIDRRSSHFATGETAKIHTDA